MRRGGISTSKPLSLSVGSISALAVLHLFSLCHDRAERRGGSVSSISTSPLVLVLSFLSELYLHYGPSPCLSSFFLTLPLILYNRVLTFLSYCLCFFPSNNPADRKENVHYILIQEEEDRTITSPPMRSLLSPLYSF